MAAVQNFDIDINAYIFKNRYTKNGLYKKSQASWYLTSFYYKEKETKSILGEGQPLGGVYQKLGGAKHPHGGSKV